METPSRVVLSGSQSQEQQTRKVNAMREVKVQITVEASLTVNTDDLEEYEGLEEYLQGVPLDDATSKQIAVAMVRYDDEEDGLDFSEFEWKIIKVTPVDE